ncbi:hypothetical protein CKM354_000284400 [Cercospora kikuchii]|uniref:Uncharacterized protein n=1 Tax=Cercospora kikuchii TaxID=84275 RepID=A0A9P3CA28_9PEZI|nr:uncharacterized protein CKM354_000284400 [Cercospora kikuchii]GIZ39462.1 hypothetical protein CKM354_000284400 [Cercospora kikuchii]
MAASKARIYALTGSVAAITATGAWYGAGLNMRQEYKQERQKAYEATATEKLAQLETMRAQLQRTKDDLQAKIDKLNGKEIDPNSSAGKTATGMQGTLEGRTRTS